MGGEEHGCRGFICLQQHQRAYHVHHSGRHTQGPGVRLTEKLATATMEVGSDQAVGKSNLL